MKKKIFLIFLILIILLAGGIIYLNRVFLPLKIKALLIKSIEEQTQAKVTLESLEFSIFRGLILRNLTLSDGSQAIVSLKEASFTFLIWPFFKKQIIIPNIRIKSLVLFLERRLDNTLNIFDLFPKKAVLVKKKFNIFIFKINASDGRIDFQDNTTKPAFLKTVSNLNLGLTFSMPGNIRFKLKSEVKAALAIKLAAVGEYKIVQQQLVFKVSIKDFSPKEFSAYYQDFAFAMPEGTIDTQASVNLKNSILDAYLNLKAKGLILSQDKFTPTPLQKASPVKVWGFTCKLNSDTEAHLQYNLADRQLNYSGKAVIQDAAISGLEFVKEIQAISAEVKFDNAGLSANKVNASFSSIPIQANFKLVDFNHPLLNLNITARAPLSFLQDILKDKFKFSLPADVGGTSELSLNIQAKFPLTEPVQLSGYLDVLDATVKPQKLNQAIQGITGRFSFSQDELKWSKLKFQYSGTDYLTTGALSNFQKPRVQLELASRDLSLQAVFAVAGKVIKVSQCNGRYLHSDFSLTADLDVSEPQNLQADIDAGLDVDLADIKVSLEKSKALLENIKASGKAQVKLALTGNINDIRACLIKAEVLSRSLSIYGLKPDDFLLDYSQSAGTSDMPRIHFGLYGGTIDGSAKINLASSNFPFWVNLDMQNVKLEKLKLDTAARDKDISGTIQAQLKINGFSGDLSKLSGAGQINIVDGRLWQLNLLQGLGALLFTRDFTNIVFHQGYCSFVISDRYVSSDNLSLKSNLAEILGSLKIGFDSSVDATLNVQLSEELPLSGTFKDVTQLILGGANRFGVIKISGTLNEPKYKFKPAVVDIIKSLKDIFLKQR